MAAQLPERAYTQWMFTNPGLYQTWAQVKQLVRPGPARPLEQEESAQTCVGSVVWKWVFGCSAQMRGT